MYALSTVSDHMIILVNGSTQLDICHSTIGHHNIHTIHASWHHVHIHGIRMHMYGHTCPVTWDCLLWYTVSDLELSLVIYYPMIWDCHLLFSRLTSWDCGSQFTKVTVVPCWDADAIDVHRSIHLRQRHPTDNVSTTKQDAIRLITSVPCNCWLRLVCDITWSLVFLKIVARS